VSKSPVILDREQGIGDAADKHIGIGSERRQSTDPRRGAAKTAARA
jgi:hypothetical protein